MDIDKEIAAEFRRDSRWKRVQQVAILVTLAAVVAAVVLLGMRDYNRGQALAELGLALNNQRQQTEFCAENPDARSTKACTEPVTPSADDIVDEGVVGPIGPMGPSGQNGNDGRQGPRGPRPSSAQVQKAVNLYCSTGQCDGLRPTATQVSVAVATYCNDRGECRGREGDQGGEGQDGQQGPPPSAEQVADAVANYCGARGECEGPAGPQGAAGTDGTDGTNGTDARPLVFSFIVDGIPTDTEYRVECTQATAPGCNVTSQEVAPGP